MLMGGHTVLIVEDDSLIAMDLMSMLEDIGLEICETVDTEDAAVAAAALHQPDLVIADYHLRHGDGLGAVQRIKEHLDVSVLFVSGSRSELRRRDPTAVCVDKPYTKDSLESGLSTVLKASGAAEGRLPRASRPLHRGLPRPGAADILAMAEKNTV